MMSAHETSSHSLEMCRIHARKWLGDTDLPHVVELFNRCACRYPTDPATTLEEMRSDMSRPEIDTGQNVRLWECDGVSVGFAALVVDANGDSRNASVWWRIAPDAPEIVGAALAQWVVARVNEVADTARVPVQCHVMMGGDSPQWVAPFLAEGFGAVRTFVELVHSPSCKVGHTTMTPGYSVRATTGIADWSEWVQLRNAAFADEWRFVPKTLAQAIQFRSNDPSFRPAGDLVAVTSSGAMVGLCQCVVRAVHQDGVDGHAEGRVALLGVHPEHRRRGLGRALLGAGLEWLRHQGVLRITLGTDAESTSGALALYQSVGFQMQFQKRVYERQFNPRLHPPVESIGKVIG